MKTLTWKKKNRLLLIGALLLLWIVYAFALRNTIDARSECRTLQAKLDSSAGAPQRLTQLKDELAALDAITCDSGNSVHEQLLGVVTNYCGQHGLTLRDFAPPVRYRSDAWTVETHPVTVEGNYISLLQLVHRLEQEKNGKVVSVVFHSKRDNKTQALALLVTIYVQNIIREKS